MNYAAVLALLLIAFFLFSAGYEFIGFLAITGAILAALTSGRPQQAPMQAAARSAQHQANPVYVQTTGGKIPQKMRIRIKPRWRAKSHWEDFGLGIGSVLESVGGTIFNIVSGGHSESETEQTEAKRGR